MVKLVLVILLISAPIVALLLFLLAPAIQTFVIDAASDAVRSVSDPFL